MVAPEIMAGTVESERRIAPNRSNDGYILKLLVDYRRMNLWARWVFVDVFRWRDCADAQD